MPRLFVAVDPPPEIRRSLQAIQPAEGSGVRVTPPEQIHLTLHFLGEADPAEVAAAIESVIPNRLWLSGTGVGSFRRRDGRVILWAGVDADPELMQFHRQLGEQLAQIGCRVESRPYQPHFTLARLTGRAGRQLTAEWQAEHANFVIPRWPVTSITLYSSVLSLTGAQHLPEAVYRLEDREL